MVPSPWKLAWYGLIITLGCLIAAPNLFSADQLRHWPDWLPKAPVALGLDLRGGAHLVLEIDSQALRQEQLQTLLGEVKRQLQQQRLVRMQAVITGDSVVVRASDDAQLAFFAAQLRADGRELQLTQDAGALRLQPSAVMLSERQSTALEQSLEIVRRRIDAVGVAEPTVQRLGTDRILVQLPGVRDPSELRTLLGSTAKLTFHRVHSADATRPAPELLRLVDASGSGAYMVEARPMLQGERLVHASAGFDQLEGTPIVSFRFDDLGTRLFADITSKNVGRQFAIVLDGKVISAPLIQEPITGGAGQIEGRFTTAEASSLAALLRAGALPVPLSIIEERSVGPDLGSDAIRTGTLAAALGLLLVLGFMTVLYGAWGLVANLALLTNIILTLAALRLLDVTLTLPGIAGIVLGIGLAVDANVLINERIREETHAGKSAFAAFDLGFKRAYATIVDSNLTTLIATALLFAIGSGPVQGFAVTMAFGIVISMFTAVAVVRALMGLWLRWRRPAQFVIGTLLPSAWLVRVPSFRFMRARFVGIAASLLLSIGSCVLFFMPGLNYGVDFTGGTIIEASAPQPLRLPELRSALQRSELGEVTLQQVGATAVLVRIQQANTAGPAQTALAERAQATMQAVEPAMRFDRVDSVGPKISGELADAGILAVLFASVAMLIYIWARFEWHFAVGAIATLILDITKTIGFFALTGLEFNLTAIAAVLTLVGYSVNDKVVVYDRMRENLRLHPQQPLREVIDRSINETLARSLYTSITALLAMLPLAILGGAAVQSFAVPMVFGIVIAASSSVFIAAPILLFLGDWRNRRSNETAHVAATSSP
jgi:SecD/SecF fusion protein